jgi:Tudor domain/MYND finger
MVCWFLCSYPYPENFSHDAAMAFSFLPATNGNTMDTSTPSEDSEDEFYKKRIMLIAENKEINLQAIKNLCDRFGELIKVCNSAKFSKNHGFKVSFPPFQPIHVPANNKNWFFAEFRTASEAEQAIRYTNQNSHLKIKAFYSKKKRRDGGGNQNSQSNRMTNDQQPMQHENGDIKIQLHNRRVQGPFAKNIGANRFPNALDSDTKMEAQMNILPNGGAYSRPGDDRFKVLNGRATFQESDANLALIQAMAEKSQGTYDAASNSYGHNMNAATNVVMGLCTKCGRVSERQCEVCMDPYCSPECQRLDWPAHKKVCRPMPALVPAVFGPEIVRTPKPVEKVVPFLPLPTPQSQLFGVLPSRKPEPVVTPMPAEAASHVTGIPLQDEIELIKQKIRSTMVTDQPKHAPFPRSGDQVVITAAPSSGVLYLRAIDSASDISFRQVIQDVTRYAATAKLLDVKPKRGDYVLAPFEGVYYRANVLSPNNNCTEETIKLAYIDFGNMTVVKWRECKVIVNSDIIGLTRHNFKVYLQNVDYTKHTNDATTKLISQCVDENVAFELRYEGTLPIKEKREVTLIRVSDNMSLNAKIKELATIVPPKLDDVAVFGYSVSGSKFKS